MTGISFVRQLDIIKPDLMRGVNIHVIGVGSVGSFTSLTLAKMGIKDIRVWDDDGIEPHNLPNQFYNLDSVGKSKVEALSGLVKDFTKVDIRIHKERLTEESDLNLKEGMNIVIVCTDDKPSRRMAWNKVKNTPDCMFIDSRMGAEMMKIYTLRATDTSLHEEYEKTLVQNGKQLPCTARTIIYNVLVLSGLIASQVKKVLTNEDYPFEIIFDLKTMTMLVK